MSKPMPHKYIVTLSLETGERLSKKIVKEAIGEALFYVFDTPGVSLEPFDEFNQLMGGPPKIRIRTVDLD